MIYVYIYIYIYIKYSSSLLSKNCVLQLSRVSHNSLITDPVHLCSIFNKRLLYNSTLLYRMLIF